MGLPALAQRHCTTARSRLSTPLRQPQRVRAPLKVSNLLWGPFWQARPQSFNCHSWLQALADSPPWTLDQIAGLAFGVSCTA